MPETAGPAGATGMGATNERDPRQPQRELDGARLLAERTRDGAGHLRRVACDGASRLPRLIACQQLAHHARYLADTLDIARSEAIKHGYRVNVCKGMDRRQCTTRGGRESGWIMVVDEHHDGDIASDERVLRRDAAPDGITAQANPPVAN